MSDQRLTGRCWYCGHRRLSLTTEHVLAEAHFGGRLKSPDAVCQSCNSVAGRIEAHVAENPFVSEAVAVFRTDEGGKRFPQSRGILPDGARVQVERRPSGAQIIHYEPRRVGTDPDGTEVWEVASGREEEFEERRRKRGARVRAVGRPLGPGGYMHLSYGIGAHNFAAWPRFVAKVALGTSSLVADQEWLDSAGALALQDMFLERRRSGGARYRLPLDPWEQDRSQPPWSLLAGREHLLALWREEDGSCRFGLALFGYLAATAEMRDLECPPGEPTWLVPCDGGRPQRLDRVQFERLLAARDVGERLAS